MGMPFPMGLRRVADELKVELTRHPRVAQVWVIGGQRRVVRVDLDRERLASFNVSILQAYQALKGVNWRLPAGATAVALLGLAGEEVLPPEPRVREAQRLLEKGVDGLSINPIGTDSAVTAQVLMTTMSACAASSAAATAG